MIISEIFYGLKCDRCGELYEDGEHSFWSDKDSAIEYSSDSDWEEINNKHYCPECYDRNEETDEITVRDPFPELVKKIEGFIEKVMKKVCYIKEVESGFELSFRTYELNTEDVNWLKNFPIDIRFTNNERKTDPKCIILIKTANKP